MLLALGPHQFDITHRAVVLGVVDPDLAPGSDELLRDAEALLVAGAAGLTVGVASSVEDAGLAVTVAALRARFGAPIVARTPSADVLGACLAEGASAGHGDAQVIGPDYLAASAVAGASVVVTSADSDADVGSISAALEAGARAAEAAGIPAERIVLDAGLGHPSPHDRRLEVLRRHDHFATLGWPVLLSDPHGSPEPGAAHAVGVIRGARILRTRQIRAARRIAEVAARLLEARDHARDLREAS